MKKIFTLFAALAMVMSMSAVPYLKGAFNGWGESNSLQSGSTDITLNANATYEFKVHDGDWYGNNGTMTSTNCTDWTMYTDAGDCQIETTIAGVYTFKWNASSNKLSVVYPTEAVEINYYITGSANLVGGDGWKANEIKMVNNEGTYTHTFTALAAGNYEMKITQGNWDNTLGFYNLATAYVGVTGNDDGNIVMALTETTDLIVTVSGTTVSLSLPEKTNTIYFVNEKGWAKVNAYVWTGDPYKPWPGEAMTKVEGKTYGGKDVYTYTYPANNSNVIFNDGSSNQTGDLTYSEATPYYYGDKWNASIAYDKAKYTVNVTANAEGENVVTGNGEYEEGKEVTVTASEDLEGWVFIGWTEDGEFVANDPEYTFVVNGDVELEAVYAMDLGENKVTDLVIDGDNMLLTGSVAGFPMGTMNLELALGEYDEEEGTFLLTEDSKLYVGETNFTFVDGMAAVDMSTNSAMAMVVFEHNGTYYYMTINMSKKIEATVIEIDNAIVTIEERSMGFGDEVYHVLKMESTWSDGETTYPVLLETTEFDQTKESQEVAASIRVGGMGDEDPWLGSAEGDVTITVANGVVTVEGLLENASAWPAPIAFDVTISGKLPVEKIAYEMNGGAFPEVKVPTNAELWEAFKPYYNEYYGLSRSDQPITAVSTFASAYMQKIMTDAASEYKWLGDYVLSVATAAGVTLSTDMAAANEGGWRWAVHAFFNAAAGQHGAAGIDFTEAGKPEVWGAAYLAEYGVVLPTEPVDAPYTLPTPVKEGYTFVGWYDNAEGTGEAYTVIPAGWSGTLYAIWKQSPATALDNIAIEGKVVKTIINGQLIIIKNGVQYNAQGAVIK